MPRGEKLAQMNRDRATHRMSKSSEYYSWKSMIQRCLNKKCKDYKNYGAIGIKVSKRWTIFENFLSDMGRKPESSLQIERKNNNGNYCKSNCRWASIKEQANNRRSNKFFKINGRRLTIIQIAEKFDIPYGRLKYRLRNKYPLHLAIKKQKFWRGIKCI